LSKQRKNTSQNLAIIKGLFKVHLKSWPLDDWRESGCVCKILVLKNLSILELSAHNVNDVVFISIDNCGL